MLSPMVYHPEPTLTLPSQLDYTLAYSQPFYQEEVLSQPAPSHSNSQANFLQLRPSHIAGPSGSNIPSYNNASIPSESHHVQVESPSRRSSPENTPSPKSTSSSSSSQGQHAWVQTSQVTTSKALNHLVCEYSNNGIKTFFCGWPGCKHPVGFTQKPQLITHIRSAHLQEKPFMCTTCKVQFSRKQEAGRHVLSMNSGRKYKCSACHQAFSRKNYRDAHEETCMFDEQAFRPPTPMDTPPLSNYSPSGYFC